jgi:hypothetical protein
METILKDFWTWLMLVMISTLGLDEHLAHRGLNVAMMSASPRAGNWPGVFIHWNDPARGWGKYGLVTMV